MLKQEVLNRERRNFCSLSHQVYDKFVIAATGNEEKQYPTIAKKTLDSKTHKLKAQGRGERTIPATVLKTTETHTSPGRLSAL